MMIMTSFFPPLSLYYMSVLGRKARPAPFALWMKHGKQLADTGFVRLRAILADLADLLKLRRE